jgi:hypothetical protein
MEKECCPKFNPEIWENKMFLFDNKLFLKGKVKTFFHIPLNFGKVMTNLTKQIEDANAKFIGGLCLSEETDKGEMNVYLAIDKEIPNAENVRISGKFLSKVYEGKFKEMGKWINNFKIHVQSKSLVQKKLYIWYTTCPKCAKKYGKNYVVMIGQIE